MTKQEKKRKETPHGKFTTQTREVRLDAWAPASRRRRAHDKLTYQRGHFRRGPSSRARWSSATVYTGDRYVIVSRRAHVFLLSLFSPINATVYRRYRPPLLRRRTVTRAIAWAVISIGCVRYETKGDEMRALSRNLYQTRKNVPRKLYNLRVERNGSLSSLSLLFLRSFSRATFSGALVAIRAEPGRCSCATRHCRPSVPLVTRGEGKKEKKKKKKTTKNESYMYVRRDTLDQSR